MNLYLSSTEQTDFEETKNVLQYYKRIIDNRNVLIIEVDKPLIGQSYGYGGEDINTFYLISRFDDGEFEKLNKFPIYVHVLIIQDPKNPVGKSLSELSNIAWATLYDNKEDADNHKI